MILYYNILNYVIFKKYNILNMLYYINYIMLYCIKLSYIYMSGFDVSIFFRVDTYTLI